MEGKPTPRKLLEKQWEVLPRKAPLPVGERDPLPTPQSSEGFQLAGGKEIPQKLAAAAANSTGTR